jgi:hypothetical protein
MGGYPDLYNHLFRNNVMTREVPIPNPPLSRREKAAFARLSREDKAAIDEGIRSCALPHWRKVAMVVSLAEEALRDRYPQFSYVLYAERIRLLAKRGRLESQGKLRYMRFSEVRLPHEN